MDSETGSGQRGDDPDNLRAVTRFDGELERDAGAFEPASRGDGLSAPPRAIGRFVVVRRLGHGSMGEVYSAFDDELGRRVAIKLLRRRPRAHESRRARMRREAQAMAKVSHPNVIQVFEVGEHGDRTFIAMEYIDGSTLERWQQGFPGKPRPREEILGAYVQAGTGLAAAHHAGVLHRDFKPANVLVDADGRVHVMDFGLAAWLRRTDSTDDSSEATTDCDERRGSPDGPRLTRAGALLGTPAFMSPEQHLGRELDARSDQFSFCVALWEALMGAHPFGDGDFESVRSAIVEGKLREGSAVRAVPPWLRRALERGMAKEPRDRWPDMAALLEALRPRPRRARWRLAATAAAAVLAATSVAYGITQHRGGLCEGAPELLARVWNDESRSSGREGLLRTNAALAGSTWDRVERELDAYTEAWSDARRQVCEATHVYGDQSSELMDQRVMCLDLRLHALAGLLDTLEEAELETVLRAVDATAHLPDVGSCQTLDLGALADAEATRPEAAELRRRLVVARARLDMGRVDEAHVELGVVRDEALSLGLRRLAAEALVDRGHAEIDMGWLKEADATLEAGLWEALARGHDEAALRAALAHARLVGVTLGETKRGQAGITHSEALLQRLGEPEPSRVKYLAVSSLVLARHGDFREAQARIDDALASSQRLHGSEHVEHAAVLDAAGAVALWGGELDLAEQRFTELAELDRRLYDPEHPNVASALNNLAVVAVSKGEIEVAEQRFREVLEVRRRTQGERHMDVGDAYMNLAGALYQRKQPELALPYIEHAHAIYAASMDDGAAKIYDAGIVHGMLLSDLGRASEAEAILRDVLSRQRKQLGEHHPDLTPSLGALGRLLTRPADAAEAVALLGAAVEIQRDKLGSAGVPLDEDSVLDGLEKDLATAQQVLRSAPDPANDDRP
jgi:tetratricopeptide (TPR) repeat protein/predicted Ser/Thr protein kinase